MNELVRWRCPVCREIGATTPASRDVSDLGPPVCCICDMEMEKCDAPARVSDRILEWSCPLCGSTRSTPDDAVELAEIGPPMCPECDMEMLLDTDRPTAVDVIVGDLVWALANLLEWAKGNRGSKSTNPYTVPEIEAALRVLAERQGIDCGRSGCRWMDVDTKELAEEKPS